MSKAKDQYYAHIWKQVIQHLKNSGNIEEYIVDSFFAPCYIYELNDVKVMLVTDDVIKKQVIIGENSFSVNNLDLLSSAFIEVLDLDSPITVEVYTQNEIKQFEGPFENSEDITMSAEYASSPIQADRTFENFVVGDCNRESQVAALACAYNPGKFYNPLFIYGNSGLGKTHLLMAIANYVKKSYPDKKVYYIESLQFVDKVVKAIQSNQIDRFKQYMCSMDLLLVDDIQFLAGKEKSHEIFFLIYNELVNNRKQICIASDRQPREIRGLEERLISRFNSGLSVGIDSPEFETSLAILRRKITDSGSEVEDIDDDGLAYIASNFSGNIRDLEGAWNRVLFYAIMHPDEISPSGSIALKTVISALKDQAVVTDTNLSPYKIIKCVADYYGLTRQQITGKTRTKNISNARHISIYLCRKFLDLPYMKIGEEFGGRDHTTIISACTKVEKQIKKDPAFGTAVKEIEKLILA